MFIVPIVVRYFAWANSMKKKEKLIDGYWNGAQSKRKPKNESNVNESLEMDEMKTHVNSTQQHLVHLKWKWDQYSSVS